MIVISIACAVFSVSQWLFVVFKMLCLALVLFGVFSAVVCLWPVIQQVLMVAPLIAVFGLATRPREEVTHGR